MCSLSILGKCLTEGNSLQHSQKQIWWIVDKHHIVGWASLLGNQILLVSFESRYWHQHLWIILECFSWLCLFFDHCNSMRELVHYLGFKLTLGNLSFNFDWICRPISLHISTPLSKLSMDQTLIKLHFIAYIYVYTLCIYVCNINLSNETPEIPEISTSYLLLNLVLLQGFAKNAMNWRQVLLLILSEFGRNNYHLK